MKKGDFIWGMTLVLIVVFLIMPSTNQLFMGFTLNHPYIAGFIKFAVLATMGELLAIRIVSSEWKIANNIMYKAVIWGFLGMVMVLIFELFANGVLLALDKGMLWGRGSSFLFAFYVSVIMNLTFAPTMMIFHKMTDTYLDLRYKTQSKIKLYDVVNNINWNTFFSFVILKTIPVFWIPAHTITFLVPHEYRVIVAASLSMALGAILAFANVKSNEDKKNLSI